MRISVVVPTFNRASLACDAVSSLLSQSQRPFEILVIDNGSTDPTRSRLTEHFGRSITILQQPRRGGAFARNLGIESASGDVVAFLDDDAVASPNWIEKMRACFDETGADAVGGPAQALWERTPPAYILRSEKALSYLGVFSPYARRARLGGFHDFLIGTNCAFRRKIFEQGRRWPEIHRGWGRPTGGADLAFTQALFKEYVVFYDPGLIVHHRIAARKATLRSLAGIAFDYGIKKVAIGRPLSPRGPRDLWGIEGFISFFSGTGYLYGQALKRFRTTVP